ncbi:MAG: FAD-dependent oxidoreductase [Gemmatimonadetes bacterium]|nr:FAD-dependent oxidoreductase [Gemmatimonadota bacterium]
MSVASRPTRRDVLRTLGTAAAGVALAGCGGSSMAGGGPVTQGSAPWRHRGAGSRTWVPVEVSPDRVTRTLVGLRPYRPGGFVLRTERLDDKPVIHNYGHGGGGITLSWGTADLAVTEATTMEGRDVAVLGCGAVGLATARLLQRRGWKVRIYARDLPPDTTSNIAAGQWSPFSVFEPDAVDDRFRDQFRRAARLAYRHYQDLVGPDYGVRWIDNYSISERPIESGSLQRDLPDLFPGIRDLGPDEHPFSAPYARRVITMIIETAPYLRRMQEDVYRAGGEIVVRELRDRREIAALPESIVVNCTGLGARDLFGDDELVPVRGQLEVLLPQADIDYIMLMGNGLYMMPKSDGIVLGGSFERGDGSLEPDPRTTDRILRGHEEFFAQMRSRIEERA